MFEGIDREEYKDHWWYDEEMDDDDIMLEACLEMEYDKEQEELEHERKYGVPDWLHEIIEEMYQAKISTAKQLSL